MNKVRSRYFRQKEQCIEHEQTRARSEIPSVLWPRSMGFIPRAVAGYEDFRSVLRVDGEEGTLLVWVSQDPLAESPVQWWALGFLSPCLVFPQQLSFFFLGWHLFCMVSCRGGMLKTDG